MDKRAMQAGQIFIYVLAIIVVSLIIAYGYKAINDFGKRSEEVAFISFRTNFDNTVKAMVSDYGTIKRPQLDVPGEYTQVCVVDLAKSSTGSGICTPASPDYDPIVCAGWDAGANNVYLLPDGTDSFRIDHVKVKRASGYICYNNTIGKINIQMKSLGDSVEVDIY